MRSSRYLTGLAFIIVITAALILSPDLQKNAGENTSNINIAPDKTPENPKQIPENSNEVEISGKLRMVGSAPFYEFVITTADNVDYYLEAKKEELDRLRSYQGRNAKTSGIVKIRQYKYPNPAYDHERRSIFPKTLDIK